MSTKLTSFETDSLASNAPKCRICYMPDFLASPCKCKGSSGFIHCHCFLRWVHSRKDKSRKCEVCGVECHTKLENKGNGKVTAGILFESVWKYTAVVLLVLSAALPPFAALMIYLSIACPIRYLTFGFFVLEIVLCLFVMTFHIDYLLEKFKLPMFGHHPDQLRILDAKIKLTKSTENKKGVKRMVLPVFSSFGVFLIHVVCTIPAFVVVPVMSKFSFE
ncbi:hypothetical protein L596_029026 [Steinernema carpocapsae]|uniref:RING-CH-type domain-containing protein n=1 Tax=Steinernema carpocapsae TaxID=34508 RepID=A0A4U5LTE8_STECR|nr:hypothetical protein L596_029026 [Steinernema carpocapsae]